MCFETEKVGVDGVGLSVEELNVEIKNELNDGAPEKY